jgi:2-C-methyl-D-erythritol 4-phosphate cytidylyltransferase
MEYVVIVAGGKGLRMGTEVPKQFLPVDGMPVLMRTIKRFHDYDSSLHIILVLPHSQQSYWLNLCDQYDFRIPYLLANGGDTRFSSVKNGLSLISDEAEGVVAIHDGVRPFVSVEVIHNCFKTAASCGAAIPVINVVETLRHVDGATVPRDDYRLVQTPQTFDIRRLKKAYMQTYREGFTDDASVAESDGMAITLVNGNRENIKITNPFDLIVAEALAKNNA